MEPILKVKLGDIPCNLAILSMPTLQGVLHLHLIGGGGGNRTRVRKSSTVSSTYLAMLFSLTRHPPTGGLMTGEPPIF